MRVRVMRTFSTPERFYRAGDVVEVNTEQADPWLKAGMMMEDKSLDGASETKAEPLPPKKVKRKRKSRAKATK